MNEDSGTLQISTLCENKINESPRGKGMIPHRWVGQRPIRQLAPVVNDLGHHLLQVHNVSSKATVSFFREIFCFDQKTKSHTASNDPGVDRSLLNVPCNACDKRFPVLEVCIKVSPVHDGGRRRLHAWLLVREGQLF